MHNQTEEVCESRKGPMTPQELRALWDAYLVPPPAKQPSYLQLAETFGRNRETVARHLQTPEFEQYRDEQLERARKRAIHRLSRGSEQAAEDWIDASANAAEKGDHRPAKELLQAVGAIEKEGAGHLPQVQVIVGMPGGHERPDRFYCDPLAMVEVPGMPGCFAFPAELPEGRPVVE